MANFNEVLLFIYGDRKNRWLKVGHYQIYVRKASHYINDKVYTTFDIANVQCPEKFRGKGNFRKLLGNLTYLIKDHSEIEILLIENVHNKRLANSLSSMGFTSIEGVITPSFFKKI